MSDLEQDPETAALERQLNAAFASARPRTEFEDELWQRIRAKGGLPMRLHELWAGFRGGPLVASGTGLAALVLVAVIAIVALRVGGAGHTTQNYSAGSARSTSLPAPALKATEGQPAAVDAQAPSVIPYYGPADMSWTGVLPTLPTTAPVLAFQQPTPDAISAFTGQAALPDPYTLSFDLTGAEPRYSISNGAPAATAGPAPSDQDAKQAAAAFLTDHKLQPGWPAEVVTTRTAQGTVIVEYLRRFTVPGAGPAVQIDEAGNRTGVVVVVGPGPAVQQVNGPLPLDTRSSAYPLRQPDAMVAAALSAPAAGSETVGGSAPKVALTRATLVYIAVRPGYYEPALLFTGSFTIGNQVYEKRVLVPAVDPSRLQH